MWRIIDRNYSANKPKDDDLSDEEFERDKRSFDEEIAVIGRRIQELEKKIRNRPKKLQCVLCGSIDSFRVVKDNG